MPGLVRELGGAVAKIDHDALLRGDPAEAVRRVPRESGPYWYRGWMIPSGRYADLERALAERDCALPSGAGIVKDYVKSRKHDWETATARSATSRPASTSARCCGP